MKDTDSNKSFSLASYTFNQYTIACNKILPVQSLLPTVNTNNNDTKNKREKIYKLEKSLSWIK